MPAAGRATKRITALFTRREVRALTGMPDNHAFAEFTAAGICRPIQLANGLWIYSRDDVQRARDERRRRGLRVPDVTGFR
jgi:hypothetical protein